MKRIALLIGAVLWTFGAAAQVTGFGTYTYDGSGNITSIGNGTSADTFVYDHYDRLAGAALRGEPCAVMTSGEPCRTQKYTYDRYGNILSVTTAPPVGSPTTQTMSVDTASNRLTGAGYVYDTRGNLLNDPTRQFTYDGLDMMTTSETAGLRRIYIYSATDERVVTVGKTSAGFTGSDWSLRDASGRVLRRLARDTAGTFTWTEDYIYRGGDLLSAEVPTPEKIRNFHLDHLGTPRLITGNGGAEIADHHYLPFGAETSQSTADSEKAKFTGHERDTPSLDYMHARYYDPNWGRFLSVDSGKDWDLARPQSWNMYTYVRNNPINRIDPTGRCGEKPGFVGPRLPCSTSESEPKKQPKTFKPEPAGGPPVPVPGIPDADWKFNRDPQNPRGGTYGPTKPRKGKGGGQPSASWEGDAAIPHWDIDDGLGNRRRYDEHGNFVTPEAAHGKPAKRTTSLTRGDLLELFGLTVFGAAVTLLTGGGAGVQTSPAGVPITPTTMMPPDPKDECPTCT